MFALVLIVAVLSVPCHSHSELHKFRNEDSFSPDTEDVGNIRLLKLLLQEQRGASGTKAGQTQTDVGVRDPDEHRNLTELITSKGYPVEVYTVRTKDNFLLDLHRIPHGRRSPKTYGHGVNRKPKSAVFLQHAFLSSACDWVINFQNQSLGFILADNGYDVWMGNSRGNRYSRHHVSLSPDDPKFWDWSVDEMAAYDMPAFIDFVLNKTGQPSLSLIGHSQGSMMNFALFSERPDMEKKVKVMFALAPVAYIGNITSPIKYLSLVPDSEMYSAFGRKSFLTSNAFSEALVDLLCQNDDTKWICEEMLFQLLGPDFKNLNQSRLAVYLHHSPCGIAVKDLVHMVQLYRHKNFGKYNYGSREANIAHYNQPTPPEYNISRITVPVVGFSGGKDWLADPWDVKRLMESLPNVQAWYTKPDWNHIDYVLGLTAAQECYDKVLHWLHRYNS